MDTNDKFYNYMISNNFYTNDNIKLNSRKALKDDMVTSKKYNSAGIYLWSLLVFILMIVLLSINMTM